MNRILATAALIVLPACTSDVVELGCIERPPDLPIHFEAPTTAAVGEPFPINIRTYALWCVSFERTDLELGEATADVYPMDKRHTPGENEGCIALITFISHEVTAKFDSPGEKTITIHGRHVEGGSRPYAVDEPLDVPITITVQ